MKTLVLASIASIALLGVASAADMYVKAPPPPPVVGKAPIGKAPIGKAPLGKGPVVTRG